MGFARGKRGDFDINNRAPAGGSGLTRERKYLDGLAGLPAMPVASLIYAFSNSSFGSGKLIVCILFAGSILAWTVMLTKHFELRRALKESRWFLDKYRRESHPVALFLRRQRFDASPVFRVYESGCSALGGEVDQRGGGELLSERTIRINRVQMEVVRNAADRMVADQAFLLERKMGWLATAVSASPFLGLLGTVWGVMDAFVDMALKGSAQLSTMAPGISAALLTTVVGLFVALPSSIGYNLLVVRIREITVMMDNFAQEFAASVQRNFLSE